MKSYDRVEKEVSPPLEGSPVLWHIRQLEIVHSVHPVPIAKKVLIISSHSLHRKIYEDSSYDI